MRRERRNNNLEDKMKWGRLVSFIIAIILLIIAIVASMSQEKTISSVNYNRINQNTSVEEASSELSKNVNQVLEQNSVGGDNEEEKDEEINEIRESIIINNTTENNANVVEDTNANIINQNTNETAENKENSGTNENASANENNNTIENTDEKNESANQTSDTEFIFPVEGEVIKEFAKDNLIYSETLEEWITHTGIDIKADRTTVVKSVANGTVKSIKNDPRYGLTVTIEHDNGYTSVYSSLLTAEFVKEGEQVTQGQTIGTVGNSAVFEVAEDNHLHFELLKDGSSINPEIYLK